MPSRLKMVLLLYITTSSPITSRKAETSLDRGTATSRRAQHMKKWRAKYAQTQKRRQGWPARGVRLHICCARCAARLWTQRSARAAATGPGGAAASGANPSNAGTPAGTTGTGVGAHEPQRSGLDKKKGVRKFNGEVKYRHPCTTNKKFYRLAS